MEMIRPQLFYRTNTSFFIKGYLTDNILTMGRQDEC